MSRMIGFAIIGLAVYLAINSLPEINTRSEHDTAVAIATDNREGMARDIAQTANSGRSFSSSNPMTAQSSSRPVETVDTKNPAPIRRASPTISDAQIVRAAERVKSNGESLQLAAAGTAPAAQPVLIRADLVPPLKPENIALETQRELKRVGCYRGRVDGKWRRGSRKALRKYVKRSRIVRRSRGRYRRIATRPSAGILDTLRKTSRKICGRPCASGKMLSSSGRCVNDPVIMAGLTAQDATIPALQPVRKSARKRAKKAKRSATRVRYLKKARAKRNWAKRTRAKRPRAKRTRAKRTRARRKWRKKRVALGGPRYYKKRRAWRRSAAYYRAKRRKRIWIGQVFSE